MSSIPSELSSYFSISDFINYPLIGIPQTFKDERGAIINLADGQIGDVSMITSKEGAVRANHVHQNDWHLCFLISGSINYTWKDSSSSSEIKQIKVSPGEMIYTPPGAPHKMHFLESSQFVTISKLSRLTASYELDTLRFSGLNFDS
jgi:dTDP-4-dehydrorhamnose 3,5-epimerase-like enzyme